MSVPESNSQPMDLKDVSKSCRDALFGSFTEEHGAILVVGHGTRNPAGAAQLIDLVTQMRTAVPSAVIEACFLELASPTIESAIEALSAKRATKLLVVPVLLFSAAHAQHDIPDAVAVAATKHCIEVLGQTASLGTHPAVMSLVNSRFEELVALGQGSQCPANACAQVKCPAGMCGASGLKLGRIGLAMVGRGTSDLDALNHMRQLTQLHASQLDIATYETGFFAGGTPKVDELLSDAAKWDCDTIVVHPHLLFEGELIDQLREKVLAKQASDKNRRWLVGRTLGADPKLAAVFLELAEELIRQFMENPNTRL